METTAAPALTSRSINIPRLALDAANELDEVEHGRLKESPAAKELGALLVSSLGNGKAATQATAASGTVAVFCSALERLQNAPKITNMPQLFASALKYAEQLNSNKGENGKTNLATAKDFCIALAKAAAGYRESVISTQTRNRWS